MKDKLISAENELYPGISGHFPLPRVKNCLGDKMMLSDVTTTLMWFMTEGRLPQPQKDHWGGWRIYGGDVAMQINQFYSCQFSTIWSTELAKLVILRTKADW